MEDKYLNLYIEVFPDPTQTSKPKPSPDAQKELEALSKNSTREQLEGSVILNVKANNLEGVAYLLSVLGTAKLPHKNAYDPDLLELAKNDKMRKLLISYGAESTSPTTPKPRKT